MINWDDDEGEELPDTTNYMGWGSLRVEVWPLLHKGADRKPETVGQSEDILDNKPWVNAEVRIRPHFGGELSGGRVSSEVSKRRIVT